MKEPKEFLEYIVKGIVDNPEDVNVVQTVDEIGTLLTLTVNQEDMGQVIGKQGATATSIRTLIRIAGMKQDARVNVKINEPQQQNEESTPSSEE